MNQGPSHDASAEPGIVRTPSDASLSLPHAGSSKALRTADGRGAVLVGDCLKILRDIPAASIDTVLTSPPYWQTRDYGKDPQVGAEEQPQQYVARLVDAFREVHRVLTRRGTAWLNIGDVYMRGPKYSENSPRRYDQGWVRNKQLGLLPFRVAIALQDAGWIVRNVLVWSKPNAIPASVEDRLATRWEPVFLLAKDEEYFFDLDRMRVPAKTSDLHEAKRLGRQTSGKAVGREDLREWLNSPRHRVHIEGLREISRRPEAPDSWVLAAYLKEQAKRRRMHVRQIARALHFPYERTRHYFRPDKIGSRLPPPEVWLRIKKILNLDRTPFDDAMQVEVGDNRIRNHPKGKNPGDCLEVNVEPFGDGHYATMLKALAHALLPATLPAGGICLDPFCGAGTTGLVALALGGRFIGIELLPRFARMAMRRIESAIGNSRGDRHQRRSAMMSSEKTLPLWSTSTQEHSTAP